MRKCLLLALTAALAGCATTRTVQVPVPVPCITFVPERPELMAERVWAETTDVWARARALLVDRLRLLSHAERLEATLAACRAAAAAASSAKP